MILLVWMNRDALELSIHPHPPIYIYTQMGPLPQSSARTPSLHSSARPPKHFYSNADSQKTMTSSQYRSYLLNRTETEEFGHEPFQTFKDKVELLCRLRWRSTPPPKRGKRYSIRASLKKLFKAKKGKGDKPEPERQYAVEPMTGGQFNRVVVINITEPKAKEPSKYVLRVPRENDHNVASDAAILRFVEKHFPSIPVPRIVAVDSSRLNPISKPYMIQNRLPGR